MGRKENEGANQTSTIRKALLLKGKSREDSGSHLPLCGTDMNATLTESGKKRETLPGEDLRRPLEKAEAFSVRGIEQVVPAGYAAGEEC